jgi:ATP-dependent Zn protease
MMCFTGLTGAELASISNEAAIRAARRASTEVCIYTLTYTHAHTYN